MKTSSDDWTSVDKKRRNKSTPQNNKHKKPFIRNNSVGSPKSGKKTYMNTRSSGSVTELVRQTSETSIASPSGSADPMDTLSSASVELNLLNPWSSGSSKIKESLSVSHSMKELTINDIPLEKPEAVIEPDDFNRICRAFDVTSTELTNFLTKGLVNTGCACFRNSILQALLSLTPFMSLISTLIRLTETKAIPNPPFPVWKEIVALYREFTIESQRSREKSGFEFARRKSPKNHHSGANISANLYMSLLFANFNTLVASKRPTKRSTNKLGNSGGGSQEDAMEFLTYLLDVLHEEIVQFEASILVDSNDNTAATNTNQSLKAASSEDDGWNTVTTKKVVKNVIDDKTKDIVAKESQASVISRLFHCTLRSEVHYKTKKINSITFQRLFCVTLDVRSVAFNNKMAANTAKKAVTLEQCLDLYFSEEIIDEGEIKKQLKFDSLPEVLVLQLSRFSYDYYRNVSVKIMQEVSYPLELQLTRSHISDELATTLQRQSGSNEHRTRSRPQVDENAGLAAYNLSSVVLHHGENATKGHYSTLAKDVNSGAWRSLNDNKVASVSEEQVESARSLAYILFYTRKRTELN